MPLTRLPEPPPGLQARCDAVVNQLISDLAGVQAAYAATHNGRLWQGIISHPTPPTDGQEAEPDLSRKPSDQAEDWTAVGLALPATMPCAVRVDVYQTPAGQWGYVVSGEIVAVGKRYRRSVNVGPEGYRDSQGGWNDVTPTELGAAEPAPSAAELGGVGLAGALLPKRARRVWWLLVPAGLLAAGAAAAGLGGVEWIAQLLRALGLG